MAILSSSNALSQDHRLSPSPLFFSYLLDSVLCRTCGNPDSRGSSNAFIGKALQLCFPIYKNRFKSIKYSRHLLNPNFPASFPLYANISLNLVKLLLTRPYIILSSEDSRTLQLSLSLPGRPLTNLPNRLIFIPRTLSKR